MNDQAIINIAMMVVVPLVILMALMLMFLCSSIGTQYKIVKGIRHFKEAIADSFRPHRQISP